MKTSRSLLHFLFLIFYLGNPVFAQNQGFSVSDSTPNFAQAEQTPNSVNSTIKSEKLSYSEINKWSFKELFSMGIFLGFILILLIYSFLVYINIKQPIFLWFFVYVFAVSIQVFLMSGSIIAIDSPYFSGLSVINSLFIFASFKQFFQVLLKTKTQFKFIDKWLSFILLITTILTSLYFLIPEKKGVIIGIRIFFFIAIVFTLFGTRKNEEQSPLQVKLLVSSLVFLILAGFILTIREFEIALTYVSSFQYGILLIAIHILLFSVSILYRIKKLGDKRESLWQEIRQTKKELLESYLSGVEEERNRIVDELEHSVLSDIERLKQKLKLANEADVDTYNQLQEIQNDVKNISVKIEGTKGTNTAFIKKIQSLITDHQTDKTRFSFDFFNFSEAVIPEVETNLFNIIQEAIQNIEKYANATKVEIQILQNEKELILSIEDNGVGFDSNIKPNGIGLVNIRQRVAKINGTFNLSTSPGNGVSIIIVISFIK
jgi:signal transduction histidine kinase